MSIENQIVVGMSGHIDHGKTSLVKLLTGKDTDSLKQEKDRGMTIDIGFAFLNRNITIIDVPGHEKFVKNMMSGASGIDIAVLVIAADDGVMPQTIEHFEILKILNIKKGFIVINKIDLVNSEWLDLIKEDIKVLVKGSFLEGSNILLSSAEKEVGISDIKKEILEVSDTVSAKQYLDIFRMHIDRVFSKSGFGTIVTGTITSGSVKLGDTLDLLPSNIKVRVRSIQTHEQKVEEAVCGDRAAINIANVNASELKRGYHLSKESTFSEVDQFVGKIKIVDSHDKSIKNNQRLRVHLGTKEVMCRISVIKSNERNMVLLFKLESSIVAAIGDRFIVRMFSPVRTIAGGKVLYVPFFKSWEKIKEHSCYLSELSYKDKLHGIVHIYCQNRALNISDIEKILNIEMHKFIEIINNDDRYEKISFNSFEWIISSDRLKELKDKIIDTLTLFHKENQIEDGCNKNILIQKTNIEENLLIYLLDDLSINKKIKKNSENWSLYHFKININSELNKNIEKIKVYLHENNFIENKDSFIKNNFSIKSKDFFSSMSILENNNTVKKINSELFISTKRLIQIKSLMKEFCEKNVSFSIPEFKEITNLSRKYAVPLLEYLDRNKFTYRVGDKRELLKGNKDV